MIRIYKKLPSSIENFIRRTSIECTRWDNMPRKNKSLQTLIQNIQDHKNKLAYCLTVTIMNGITDYKAYDYVLLKIVSKSQYK